MIKLGVNIEVTDYYDQQGEGIRLNNQTVTGEESNDTENIVIKKVLINRGDSLIIKVSDLVTDLKVVNTVSMTSQIPQQFKDSYSIPVPIKVLWGTLYMGAMSSYFMAYVEGGLQNDLTFTEPVFPEDKNESDEYIYNQILVTLFLDIRE